MAGDWLTILNLKSLTRRHLFTAARSMVEEEHYGPALVVAQAAVEVAVETAIAFALQVREVPNPVQLWIADRSTIASWSPTNTRVQRLWKALTADAIRQAPGWTEYERRLKDRHLFVHRAAPVTREQAERFIAAAEQVVGHVVAVMEGMGEELGAANAEDRGPSS